MGKTAKGGCGCMSLLVIIPLAFVCINSIIGPGSTPRKSKSSSTTESRIPAGKNKSPTKPSVPKVDLDWVLTEAQYAVTQVLHDPGSADFEYINESNIVLYPKDDPKIQEFKNLGTVYLVWGKVRAKNAFGATVLSYYGVDVQFTKKGNYIIRDIVIE